ncbi:tRNA pseudouridine synthase A (chromatophore) [Paulinella micropora]|uniref:tRNA pseudouridine synthase n=1 Tax=Paulinella micropora TaxID=1928728 RepID=A0A1S6YIH8_9EUKA|nr:tRNA pseudouridine synthase A [Paulinella micropora]BBL86317.1 tRNA pseudouridine synthase A [Paulinella micropora]
MLLSKINKSAFGTEIIDIHQSSLRRIALCLQYDGSSYCGWQRQINALSVQEVLEAALTKLNNCHPVITFAAGRTDAGVHAAAQVVHFDTDNLIPAHRWASALNGYLPSSIRVYEATQVPSNWHACYSAIYRRYRYTVLNSRQPNLFLAPYSWHRYKDTLDECIMRRSMGKLVGEHDFSAFQRAGSSRSHSITTIQDMKVQRHGELIVLEIQASGFLYGMVRLIVSQLVEVGAGRLSEFEFERRWRSKHRSEINEAAPAQGLCLVQVGYPQKVFSTTSINYDFTSFLI